MLVISFAPLLAAIWMAIEAHANDLATQFSRSVPNLLPQASEGVQYSLNDRHPDPISTPKAQYHDPDEEVKALIRNGIRLALPETSSALKEAHVRAVQACIGEPVLEELYRCIFEDLQAAGSDPAHVPGSVVKYCMFPKDLNEIDRCIKSQGVPGPIRASMPRFSPPTLQPSMLYEVMEERALVPLLRDLHGRRTGDAGNEAREMVILKRTNMMKHPAHQSDVVPHRLN